MKNLFKKKKIESDKNEIELLIKNYDAKCRTDNTFPAKNVFVKELDKYYDNSIYLIEYDKFEEIVGMIGKRIEEHESLEKEDNEFIFRDAINIRIREEYSSESAIKELSGYILENRSSCSPRSSFSDSNYMYLCKYDRRLVIEIKRGWYSSCSNKESDVMKEFLVKNVFNEFPGYIYNLDLCNYSQYNTDKGSEGTYCLDIPFLEGISRLKIKNSGNSCETKIGVKLSFIEPIGPDVYFSCGPLVFQLSPFGVIIYGVKEKVITIGLGKIYNKYGVNM